MSAKNPTRPESQARARPPAPTTGAERRAIVEGLMRADLWERGKTGPELAEGWGCSPHAVEIIAAKASRALRAGSPSDEREALLVTLDVAESATLCALDETTGLERAKVAGQLAAIARTRAEVLGLRGRADADPTGPVAVGFPWDAPVANPAPTAKVAS